MSGWCRNFLKKYDFGFGFGEGLEVFFGFGEGFGLFFGFGEDFGFAPTIFCFFGGFGSADLTMIMQRKPYLYFSVDESLICGPKTGNRKSTDSSLDLKVIVGTSEW